MKTETMVCIVCPRGCTLTVDCPDNAEPTVSGNSCKKGYEFALNELTAPMRTICTTVKTVFPQVPVLPVRVSAEIPKDKIFDVMKQINAFVLDRRVERGEVIIKNILNLGVDIIATSGILKA